LTHNQGVPGSSPGGTTKNKSVHEKGNRNYVVAFFILINNLLEHIKE